MDAQNYLEHDKKSTTNNNHPADSQPDPLRAILEALIKERNQLEVKNLYSSSSSSSSSSLPKNNQLDNNSTSAKGGAKPKTAERDMIEMKSVPANDDNMQKTIQMNICEPIEANSSSGNIDNNYICNLDDDCQISAEIERLEQEVRETHQSMIERTAPTLSPPEDYDNGNGAGDDKLVEASKEQTSETELSVGCEPKMNKKTPLSPQPASVVATTTTTTTIATMDTNSDINYSPEINQQNSLIEQQDNNHKSAKSNFSPESPPDTASSSPSHLTQSQVDQLAVASATSTKITDNLPTNIGDQEKVPDEEVGSALGRNRRVRQKNRYFLDFHCIDLVKGCRSKDDYDAYPSTDAGSATRSSNRRSTTDSSRSGLQEEDTPVVFIEKYCRKCSNKTPHDFENGCQACLYKQIVLTSKRQKTSSQRSRSSRSQSQRQDKANNSGNNEPASQAATTTTTTTTTTTGASTTSNSRSKRKASKQVGGPNKQTNHNNLGTIESDISLTGAIDTCDGIELATTNAKALIRGDIIAGDNNDDNDSSNNNDATSALVSSKVAKLTATMKVDGIGSKSKWVIKPGRSQNDENVISIRREVEHDTKNHYQQQQHHSYTADDKSSTIINHDDEMILVNNNNNSGNNNKITNACDMKANSNLNSNKSNINNNNDNNSQINGLELKDLDTWTPDQVAHYVSSKGFVSEAESFRAQAVDGISLLLMQRTDFTYGLKMKLGPALKLYDQVCKLKREYFRDIATAS